MPKKLTEADIAARAKQAKLDAANERRRLRRAAQKEEAAEALKLEHFVEIAATGGAVADPSGKSPKQMAKARDAVWEAFTRVGGVEALTKFAEKYPKEFFTQIFAKLIPRVSELDTSDSLEELLAQMGNGKIPGMLEHHTIADAEFTEVDTLEVTPETLQ